MSRRALLVGGDGASTFRLRAALAHEGFGELVQCPRGEMIPVIERVRAFDLVLLASDDVERGASLDLVAYLRHRLPDTPIVFICPADSALLGAAARERGAAGCLVTPLATAAVAVAVRAAVRGTAAGGRRDVPDERALVHAGPPRAARGHDDLWAIVPAGGSDRRLVGRRGVVGQTFEPMSFFARPQRTVLASVGSRRRNTAGIFGRAVTTLAQPRDRGTAPAVMLCAHWIAERDPEATVAILPPDDCVTEQRRFTARVAAAAAFVDAHPARIALLGRESTDGAQAGTPWSAFVVVARASTLIDVERQLVPLLHAKLAAVVPRLSSAWGVAALRSTYAHMPTTSFSSAIVERCAPLLTVLRPSGATSASPRRLVGTPEPPRARLRWLQGLGVDR